MFVRFDYPWVICNFNIVLMRAILYYIVGEFQYFVLSYANRTEHCRLAQKNQESIIFYLGFSANFVVRLC